MNEKKNVKICFAASSGGHYEQLMMLKPLMEKYDSFVITEKTDYSAEAKGEKILDILPQNYIGFSREIENDIITGIEKQISYINTKYDFLKKILIKVINKLKIKDKEKYVYYLRYSNFLKTINQDEICFITGGDMLCYGNNQVNYIVDYLHNKNITTVLWGCSFGEENYTSEKFKALSECSLITVRESLTYEYMTNKLGLKQVLLYPDPAFVLAPESINLPSYFENDCVGINLSNFVSGSVNATTCFEKNVINLMEYILSETTMTIVVCLMLFDNNDNQKLIKQIFKNHIPQKKRIKMYRKVVKDDLYKLNGGIGLSLCLRYAKEGCNVIFTVRSEKNRRVTYEYLRKNYPEGKYFGYLLDLCCVNSIEQFLLECSDINIDIVINNAGVLSDIDRNGLFRKVKKEYFEKSFNTNLIGMKILTDTPIFPCALRQAFL